MPRITSLNGKGIHLTGIDVGRLPMFLTFYVVYPYQQPWLIYCNETVQAAALT